MRLETVPYDSAEHLRTPEDVALYLEAALEDGDPALVRHALGVVARAQGTARGAREAPRPRASRASRPCSAPPGRSASG